jgi:hypothetical protein
MLRDRSPARFAPNGLREPREACTPSYGSASYNASARPAALCERAEPDEKFEVGPADGAPPPGALQNEHHSRELDGETLRQRELHTIGHMLPIFISVEAADARSFAIK